MEQTNYRNVISTVFFEIGQNLTNMKPSVFVNYFLEIRKLNEDTRDSIIVHYLVESLTIVSSTAEEEWKTNVIHLIEKHFLSLGYKLPTTKTKSGSGVVEDMTLDIFLSMLLRLKNEEFLPEWNV